ncbi:MAG: response regulator transcription factor [Bacteroidales bacterium]|nr:response regulator transcription factor [Bacteroidales bacterium]MBN2763831.1 response regulator transcription factor [Bacteroidales bacterium]
MRTTSLPYILVVDDEEDICEIIKFNLESEGFRVDTAHSAEAALQKQLKKYQLFVFDIMMKGMSGFKLTDEIRNKKKLKTPVVFLTAKNTENDKLTGFSLGADDYITKPFSVRELNARVKAVLRRPNLNEDMEPVNLKVGELELDQDKKKLFLEGNKVDLTPHEYYIMKLFMNNTGKVFNREEILNYAWKENINVLDRTVDVHITRLRKKLGEYGKFLISRSGHGYCFEIE